MIKIGTVVQANSLAEGPFRSGNTYRIRYIDETIVKIGVSGNEVTLPINDFYDLFKLVPDDLCPSCLKARKNPTDDWCKPCEDT